MSLANASGNMTVGDLAKQMMLLDAYCQGVLWDESLFATEVAEALARPRPAHLGERAGEMARWYAVLGVTMKWLHETNVLRRAPQDWEDLTST